MQISWIINKVVDTKIEHRKKDPQENGRMKKKLWKYDKTNEIIFC